MNEKQGVYHTYLKNGSDSFRSGITINNKHISLGSYSDADMAQAAYFEAISIYNSDISIDNMKLSALSYKKAISLINLRDNKIYFKTPIYLFRKYFFYYINAHDYLIFDVDDLFYYSTHSIMKRGSHLFVADYGMQVSILSRYGVHEHSVCGRDYYFANGNKHDFRYGNILIINKYHGVSQFLKNGRTLYKSKIHINGDYVIGTYKTEDEAAIAYNKAADILHEKGCKKSFPENYPESLSPISYASIYNSVKISARIRNYRFL